jgi:hypothetical protein
LTDLNRRIRKCCELMSVEQDGDRMLVLAAELEQLFEQKDLIALERNRLYREKYSVPSTVNPRF